MGIKKFFKEYGNYGLGDMGESMIKEFYDFRKLLPDLVDVDELAHGADGMCFVYRHGAEDRVIKFGEQNHWRDGEHDEETFIPDVVDAFDLIDRLTRLCQIKELCLPKVYEAVALDHRFYFIVMEYFPESFYSSIDSSERVYLELDQYQGTIDWVKDVGPSENIKLWIESVNRLRKQGFVHRDLHLGNVRVNKEGLLKLIDLESMCQTSEIPQEEVARSA